MSEIRKDIITGNYVVIAVERSKRPHDFAHKRPPKKGGFCPFCYGNEQETPPEVAALRPDENTEPDTPGWEIRIVPNKFGAVKPDIELKDCKDGIYSYVTGRGAAEVVIESPRHDSTLGSHEPEHVNNLLKMIRDRYNELGSDENISYVQVFKNFGPTAGASLEHPHWQIISTPLIPTNVMDELKGTENYYRKHGTCPYCEMIEEELKDGSRIVAENDYFVALCPYASRFPFETWILPKEHNNCFGKLTGKEFGELTEMLQGIVKKTGTRI